MCSTYDSNDSYRKSYTRTPPVVGPARIVWGSPPKSACSAIDEGNFDTTITFSIVKYTNKRYRGLPQSRKNNKSMDTAQRTRMLLADMATTHVTRLCGTEKCQRRAFTFVIVVLGKRFHSHCESNEFGLPSCNRGTPIYCTLSNISVYLHGNIIK